MLKLQRCARWVQVYRPEDLASATSPRVYRLGRSNLPSVSRLGQHRVLPETRDLKMLPATCQPGLPPATWSGTMQLCRDAVPTLPSPHRPYTQYSIL